MVCWSGLWGWAFSFPRPRSTLPPPPPSRQAPSGRAAGGGLGNERRVDGVLCVRGGSYHKAGDVDLVGLRYTPALGYHRSRSFLPSARLTLDGAVEWQSLVARRGSSGHSGCGGGNRHGGGGGGRASAV